MRRKVLVAVAAVGAVGVASLFSNAPKSMGCAVSMPDGGVEKLCPRAIPAADAVRECVPVECDEDEERAVARQRDGGERPSNEGPREDTKGGGR